MGWTVRASRYGVVVVPLLLFFVLSAPATAAASTLTLNPTHGPHGTSFQYTYTPPTCTAGDYYEIHWDPGLATDWVIDTGQMTCPAIAHTLYPPGGNLGAQGSHTVEAKTHPTQCTPYTNYADAVYTLDTGPGNSPPPLPYTGGPCPSPTPSATQAAQSPSPRPTAVTTQQAAAPSPNATATRVPTPAAASPTTAADCASAHASSACLVALGAVPGPSPTDAAGPKPTPPSASGPLAAIGSAFRAVTSTPAGTVGVSGSALLALLLVGWLAAAQVLGIPQPIVVLRRLLRTRR